VIDLAIRMVTGWQLASHMRTSLVTVALAMAITHGHARPGAIFHSDRGCQYGSAEFARYCQANGLRTSVVRTGACWDNAAAESFFGALTNEMYYRQSSPDMGRARFAVAGYIEISCTRRRLHSALGYRSPWKHSQSSRPQQPLHDQQPGKLSKIVDTAQRLVAVQ
jgi:putative transposase